MSKKFDVIIVGGGPGGSTAGALLAKKSLKVAIFERETYPRFHIGESLLPASMPILKESGFYDTLSSGKYIEKYGARFTDYRSDDEIYFGFGDGFNPDIPMAYEVLRSEFDKDLLEHARKVGATVHQPERVRDIQFLDSHVRVVTNLDTYEADFLIDASGRVSMVGKQHHLRQMNRDLNNVAVFAHYLGVQRFEGKSEGDIIIGLLPNQSWSWIIPFKGERTSVGVVCSSDLFDTRAGLEDYIERCMSKSSRSREYMKNADRVAEVTVISNYSHTCEKLYGDRWISIGDAAVFLDPIFSSGVHVSISTAKFATEAIMKARSLNVTLSDDNLGRTYQEVTMKGVHRFHSLISMFYKDNFVDLMRKTDARQNIRQGFTSAVAGDMWNDNNPLFEKNVL